MHLSPIWTRSVKDRVSPWRTCAVRGHCEPRCIMALHKTPLRSKETLLCSPNMLTTHNCPVVIAVIYENIHADSISCMMRAREVLHAAILHRGCRGTDIARTGSLCRCGGVGEANRVTTRLQQTLKCATVYPARNKSCLR